MSVDGHEVWRRATPHARGASWDPISLRLTPGAHDLVFDLERADRVFAFDARILDKATLEPPSGARLRLPGTHGDDESRVSFHLARIELDAGLLPQGYQPRVRITFPRGAPVESGVHFLATPLAKGAPLGPSTRSRRRSLDEPRRRVVGGAAPHAIDLARSVDSRRPKPR